MKANAAQIFMRYGLAAKSFLFKAAKLAIALATKARWKVAIIATNCTAAWCTTSKCVWDRRRFG
jgi:hypothetical protein